MQAPRITFQGLGIAEAFVKCTPFVAAFVLFVAGGMKIDQLFIRSDSALVPWFQVVLIMFEVMLGAWLLSGACPHWCRYFAILAFTGFAGVATFKLFLGEASCGCFGKTQVAPSKVLLLDLSLVLLFVFWRPSRISGASRYGRIAMAAGAGAANVSVVVASLWAVRANSGEMVVLEPEGWVGQVLPIAGDIDIGDSLQSGVWTVVLYRRGCSQCKAALPKYQQLAEQHRQAGVSGSFALIEVPPFANIAEVRDCPSCLYGRLSDTNEWVIDTPTEVRLQSGIVVAVDTAGVR